MMAAMTVALRLRLGVERTEDAVNEFVVEGTVHGKPVKVRVFAQNAHHARQMAKQQTADPQMSFRSVKQV